jgi:hypothetical protein
VSSSTKGRWPLRAGARFVGAIQRPLPWSDGDRVATILGDYLFGLEVQPEPAQLTESRIPDAEGGFRWIISWRTDIPGGGNYDGTEQRIATLAEPRHRYEGGFFLDAADLRLVRRLLSQSPAAEYELPMPHEAVSALVEVTGGTIYVTSTYADWIETGRRIYVRGSAGDGYTTTITGASGGTINVADSPPAGGKFPAVHTLIFPLETVRLEDDHAIRRYPVNAGRWAWRARAAAREVLGAGGALTTYDGWDVLDRRPYQQREWGESVLGGVEFLDNGATMTSEESWTRSKHRRAVEVKLNRPADRQWAKAFLAARRGRYTPCLCPTWGPDLTLYEQPTAGTNTIRVTDDYLADWWPSLAHRRLQLERADGIQYVVIDSVTEVSGYQELLLRDDVAAVPITKVSFLESVRLDSDEIAIEYGTGWRGRVTLPLCTVQEVLDSPGWPTTLDEMDEAASIGTWTSAWSGGLASGSLDDIGGAVDLSSTGSPVYRRAGAMPGGMAWAVDGTSDRFEASSSLPFDLGASDSFAFYACIRFDTAGAFRHFVGKSSNAGVQWYFGTDGSGNLIAAIADGVASASMSIAVNHADGQWHDIVGGILRQGANTILFMTTDLGSGSVTSSTVGSMSNAQPFRLGGPATWSALHRNAFAAATMQGVVDIRNHAAQIIASMKAYTGRS